MKTFTVTALLVASFQSPKVWTVEVPVSSREDAADCVFHLSNCPPHILSDKYKEILAEFPRTGLRSISVGDVLIIQDPDDCAARHIATVDAVGFTFH